MQLAAKGVYSCTVAVPEVFTSQVTWSSNNQRVTISNVAATKGKLTSTGSILTPETATIQVVKGALTGQVDVQIRRGQEQRSLPLDGAVQAAAELWRSLP